MIFFGNPIYRLISGLITIVILVVVYFTVIKPTEHTVTNAINRGFKSFHIGTTSKSPADKLAHCLVRANGNLHRVQRCESKFQP